MVVGDDDIDSSLAQLGYGLSSTGSAVASDDHGCTILQRGLNTGFAQVVPIFNSSRNEWNRLRPKLAEGPRHDGGRADPIDIVVAVDEHGLAVLARASEPLDGLCEAEHGKAIMKTGETRSQKIFGGICVSVTANQQEIRDCFRQAQGCAQRSDGVRVGLSRDDPASAGT